MIKAHEMGDVIESRGASLDDGTGLVTPSLMEFIKP